MGYVLVALLGSACGVLLTWYLLIPIVTLVALGAGIAGAVKGHSLGSVLADTAILICILEASWIASVFIVAGLPYRKRTRTAGRMRNSTHKPSEHEG
jgi:phosphate/sulfate permease